MLSFDDVVPISIRARPRPLRFSLKRSNEAIAWVKPWQRVMQPNTNPAISAMWYYLVMRFEMAVCISHDIRHCEEV